MSSMFSGVALAMAAMALHATPDPAAVTVKISNFVFSARGHRSGRNHRHLGQ